MKNNKSICTILLSCLLNAAFCACTFGNYPAKTFSFYNNPLVPSGQAIKNGYSIMLSNQYDGLDQTTLKVNFCDTDALLNVPENETNTPAALILGGEDNTTLLVKANQSSYTSINLPSHFNHYHIQGFIKLDSPNTKPDADCTATGAAFKYQQCSRVDDHNYIGVFAND